MAIAAKDQKLLITFPRPPPGLPSPAKSPLLSPNPIRASDFGFIPVAYSHDDDDGDSLYGKPRDGAYNTATLSTDSATLPSKDTAELQLVLDKPSKVYSPSDTITGYILGWDPVSTHISIVLEGRAKTYINGDRFQHKDRAPLLYHIQHLTPHDHGMVPRFSISIPERTADGLETLNKYATQDLLYGRYWTNEWPVQEPYESQCRHPLPPSMTVSLQSFAALTLHVEGWGHVSYKLIAVRSRLEPATGKLKPDVGCQVPIRLTTRRLPVAKVQELKKHISTTVLDLLIQTIQLSKNRRLSLREQLRDTFNTSAPALYLRASISIPQISLPGAELKISIVLSVLPPPAGKLYNFPVPDVSIVALSFRVRSYTGMRVLYPFANEQVNAKSHTFKDDEVRIFQSPAGAIFKPKDGDFDGQACVSTVTLPKTILPSFKTYNLWRSYRLKCNVTLSAAGKEVYSRTKTDLNILAQPVGSVDDAELQQQTANSKDDATSLEMARAMVQAGFHASATV